MATTTEERVDVASAFIRRWITAAVNLAALSRGCPMAQRATWASGSAAGATVIGASPSDIGQMVVRAPLPEFICLCRNKIPDAGDAQVFCSRRRLAFTDTKDATPSGCLLTPETLVQNKNGTWSQRTKNVRRRSYMRRPQKKKAAWYFWQVL